MDALARVPLSFPTYAGILVNAAADAARQLNLNGMWANAPGQRAPGASGGKQLTYSEGTKKKGTAMITPEAINFMTTHERGLRCLAMTGERRDQLELAPMARDNTAFGRTAFTVSTACAVSIAAKGHGLRTGIVAHDPAHRSLSGDMNKVALSLLLAVGCLLAPISVQAQSGVPSQPSGGLRLEPKQFQPHRQTAGVLKIKAARLLRRAGGLSESALSARLIILVRLSPRTDKSCLAPRRR